MDILTAVKDRLKKVMPALAEQFQNRIPTFETSEVDWKVNAKLVSVNDSAHLFVPKDSACEVRQAAIRKNIVSGNEKRFLVDKEIWDQMDAINRAGLIYHELFYEYMFKLGESDSYKTRKFIQLLFAEKFKEADFWSLAAALKVPIYP